MKPKIFLTGATGFIGRFLAAEVLSRGCPVIALARPSRKEDPRTRVIQAVREIPDFAGLSLEKLDVLSGDITKPLLGLPERDWRRLQGAVFLNSSANLNFKEQLRASIEKANILGVKNLLDLFGRAGGKSFFHLSTAYVCGRMAGRIEENLHLDQTQFNNVYESSKAAGEKLVLSSQAARSYVLRPSIVIGSGKTGYATNFTGYYHTYRAVHHIRAYLSKLYGSKPIPELRLRFWGDPALKVDVVTADYVAGCTANLIEEEGRGIPHVFHLCYPNANPLQFYLDSIQEHLGLKGLRFSQDLSDRNFIELEAKEDLTFNSMYTASRFAFDDTNNRAVQEEYGLGYPQINREAMLKINDCYAGELAGQRARADSGLSWGRPWKAIQRLLYEAHLRHQLEVGSSE